MISESWLLLIRQRGFYEFYVKAEDGFVSRGRG
jgi:hypothetical protein